MLETPKALSTLILSNGICNLQLESLYSYILENLKKWSLLFLAINFYLKGVFYQRVKTEWPLPKGNNLNDITMDNQQETKLKF